MQKFQVKGMRGKDGNRPVIVSTLEVDGKTDAPQILFNFETNPLSAAFDQFVKFHARPLSVIYHAPSVNKLVELFRPPESVRLKQ